MTIEELSQLFISSRNFEIADLAAGYLGIIVFGCLAERVKRRDALVYGCGCDVAERADVSASRGRKESAWLD